MINRFSPDMADGGGDFRRSEIFCRSFFACSSQLDVWLGDGSDFPPNSNEGRIIDFIER